MIKEDILIHLFIKNGDGIYNVYNDALGCDAANTYVIKNCKVIKRSRNFCYPGIAAFLTELHAEYPELAIYIPNIGYHRYANKWKCINTLITALKNTYDIFKCAQTVDYSYILR